MIDEYRHRWGDDPRLVSNPHILFRNSLASQACNASLLFPHIYCTIQITQDFLRAAIFACPAFSDDRTGGSRNGF